MTRTILAAAFIFASVSTAAAQDNVPQMVEIPAGYYWMGSSGWGHDYDEAPVHKVNISSPFRMSVTEITNAQYELFRPEHRCKRSEYQNRHQYVHACELHSSRRVQAAH